MEAVPLYDIIFKKPKKADFHLPSTRAQQHADITFENASPFLQKLTETNPTAVIFTVTNPRPNPPTPRPSLPIPFSSLYNPEYTNLSHTELATKCGEILQNITVSQEESTNVEELTRNQSLSTKWFKYREGRLTASNFYDICHTNIQRPSVSLIKRIMQYVPSIDTPAIKWGKTKEESALKAYTDLMAQHNKAFSSRQSGLVLNPEYPTLGASPDAVTDCPCCGKGLVEIKCPFKFKNMHPCSVNDPGFYLKPHSPSQCNNQLEVTSKHFYQVQGQMAVCDVEFCDFVCWTPRGIHVERIKRDEHFFKEKMLPLLKDFFLLAILPELLTCKIRDLNNNVPTDNTVCICGKSENFDNMIACDSGHCKVEWYHFKCVGLKSPPQGSWSCLPCRKMPPAKKYRQ